MKKYIVIGLLIIIVATVLFGAPTIGLFELNWTW